MPLRNNSLCPLCSALRALCVKSFSSLLIVAAVSLAACSHSHPDPSSLTFLIEANPTNLQKILADDLPYLPLWFADVVSVHRRALGDPPLSPTADFDFPATLSTPTTVAVTH